MKRERLKIGALAVGGTVLALGLYFGLRPQASETKQFTAAESACLAGLARQFEPLITAQAARHDAVNQQAIVAYGQSQSRPDFDTAIASAGYQAKLEMVKIDTLYCEQYAKCLPTRPHQATFDGCYSVFSDASDAKP